MLYSFRCKTQHICLMCPFKWTREWVRISNPYIQSVSTRVEMFLSSQLRMFVFFVYQRFNLPMKSVLVSMCVAKRGLQARKTLESLSCAKFLHTVGFRTLYLITQQGPCKDFYTPLIDNYLFARRHIRYDCVSSLGKLGARKVQKSQTRTAVNPL